jgi:hypothetical protein
LLEGTRLTGEQRAYVTALRESGDHLLSLVNDVLDFARLGATEIDLSLAPVDVEGLLRQVAELMSPRAHEKGVEIAWAVSPGLPTILADEGRLRQILLNYAGNAVKFTEAGGVLLTAGRRSEGGRVRFSVADTGPGVAPEARAKIFEAFVQTDASHRTQLGGAGLGLAIVARLAAPWTARPGSAARSARAPTSGSRRRSRSSPYSAGQPLAGKSVAVASPNAIVRIASRPSDRGRRRPGLRRRRHRVGCRHRAGRRRAADRRRPGRSARGAEAPAGRRAVVLLTPDQRGRIDRLKKPSASPAI